MKILQSLFFCVSMLLTMTLISYSVLADGFEYQRQASKAHEDGDYRSAIRLFELAIKSGDLDREAIANAHYDTGLSYGRLQKREEAMNSYRDAITLDPRHYQALGSLCFQLTQIGQLEQALHNCNKALEVKPDYAAGITIRAEIWQRKGQNDRAEADYLKSIGLDPKNWILYFNLGRFYEITDRKNYARARYREAYDKAPDWGLTLPVTAKKFREYGFIK